MSHKNRTNSVAANSKNMGDAAAAVLHDTAAAAKKTAYGLNGFASDVVHDTKDGVRHFAHVAEKESSKAYNFLQDFVEDRPKTSISLVAGLAMIVGVILWRRS